MITQSQSQCHACLPSPCPRKQSKHMPAQQLNWLNKLNLTLKFSYYSTTAAQPHWLNWLGLSWAGLFDPWHVMLSTGSFFMGDRLTGLWTLDQLKFALHLVQRPQAVMMALSSYLCCARPLKQHLEALKQEFQSQSAVGALCLQSWWMAMDRSQGVTVTAGWLVGPAPIQQWCWFWVLHLCTST